MNKIITTLCIVHSHPKILLGMKKRGFGEGRWNGFGGKVHAGETIEEAAKRETKEECGIEIGKIEKLGVMDFSWKDNDEKIEVHVFKILDFSGEPFETEEMRPEWFEIEKIPFESMWPDDKFWMPLFLENKKFRGTFVFGKGDVVLEKELEEVERDIIEEHSSLAL